jgi:hypothetical protein
MDRATRNFDHLNRKKKEKKLDPKNVFSTFSFLHLIFSLESTFIFHMKDAKKSGVLFPPFLLVRPKKSYFFTHWPDIFACQVNFIFLQIGNPSEY